MDECWRIIYSKVTITFDLKNLSLRTLKNSPCQKTLRSLWWKSSELKKLQHWSQDLKPPNHIETWKSKFWFKKLIRKPRPSRYSNFENSILSRKGEIKNVSISKAQGWKPPSLKVPRFKSLDFKRRIKHFKIKGTYFYCRKKEKRKAF